jgi:uncharacterized protein (DUF1684 family)
MQETKECHAKTWVSAWGLLISVAILQACAGDRASNISSDGPVLAARRERDLAFKSDSQSPIPVRARAQFHGLDYFPLNPDLRFRVQLHRYPAPEHIRIATNTSEIRIGLRYGYFEFRVAGQVCRLQVYRLDDSDNPGKPYLFIPFRDATSGKETYAAGRFLDLPENTTGAYDLDFNRAYNPSCAYGDEFSCPIPPEENRLSIPIRAGEKKYPVVQDH